MSYGIDQELVHLEQIVPRLREIRGLSASWWRCRIERISRQRDLTPSQRERLTRLAHIVDELDRMPRS